MLELKTDFLRQATGFVLEVKSDKFKGILITLIIHKGKLNLGDIIVIGINYGKVKALLDDKKQNVNFALPSTPISIMGFRHSPQPGSAFIVVRNEKEAKKITNYNKNKKISQNQMITTDNIELLKIRDEKKKSLSIIIKSDVHGSLEAIQSSISQLSQNNVNVHIVYGGVGNINKSDIQLAKVTKADILAFNIDCSSLLI